MAEDRGAIPAGGGLLQGLAEVVAVKDVVA